MDLLQVYSADGKNNHTDEECNRWAEIHSVLSAFCFFVLSYSEFVKDNRLVLLSLIHTAHADVYLAPAYLQADLCFSCLPWHKV